MLRSAYQIFKFVGTLLTEELISVILERRAVVEMTIEMVMKV